MTDYQKDAPGAEGDIAFESMITQAFNLLAENAPSEATVTPLGRVNTLDRKRRRNALVAIGAVTAVAASSIGVLVATNSEPQAKADIRIAAESSSTSSGDADTSESTSSSAPVETSSTSVELPATDASTPVPPKNTVPVPASASTSASSTPVPTTKMVSGRVYLEGVPAGSLVQGNFDIEPLITGPNGDLIMSSAFSIQNAFFSSNPGLDLEPSVITPAGSNPYFLNATVAQPTVVIPEMTVPVDIKEIEITLRLLKVERGKGWVRFDKSGSKTIKLPANAGYNEETIRFDTPEFSFAAPSKTFDPTAHLSSLSAAGMVAYEFGDLGGGRSSSVLAVVGSEPIPVAVDPIAKRSYVHRSEAEAGPESVQCAGELLAATGSRVRPIYTPELFSALSIFKSIEVYLGLEPISQILRTFSQNYVETNMPELAGYTSHCGISEVTTG